MSWSGMSGSRSRWRLNDLLKQVESLHARVCNFLQEISTLPSIWLSLAGFRLQTSLILGVRILRTANVCGLGNHGEDIRDVMGKNPRKLCKRIQHTP